MLSILIFFFITNLLYFIFYQYFQYGVWDTFENLETYNFYDVCYAKIEESGFIVDNVN